METTISDPKATKTLKHSKRTVDAQITHNQNITHKQLKIYIYFGLTVRVPPLFWSMCVMQHQMSAPNVSPPPSYSIQPPTVTWWGDSPNHGNELGGTASGQYTEFTVLQVEFHVLDNGSVLLGEPTCKSAAQL